MDTDASNKATDADAALQELGGDQVAFDCLTATVTVLDADPAAADESCAWWSASSRAGAS